MTIASTFVAVVPLLVLASVACGTTTGPVAAESTYTAQLLACVERSPTVEEARACRRDVDARWGVDGGAR